MALGWAMNPGHPPAKDLMFEGFWVQQTSTNRVSERYNVILKVLWMLRDRAIADEA